MNLEIGSRVNVPGGEHKQAVVLKAETAIGRQTLYVLTWLDDSGVQFTQTFGAHSVSEANPPPVDVTALKRDLAQAQLQIAAQVHNARELSSPSRSRRKAVRARKTARSQPKSRKR